MITMTLAEIEERIVKLKATRDLAEEKLNKQLENIEFKRSQNGTDSVEMQNIDSIMEQLRKTISDCNTEIELLERQKLSLCERKKERHKLWSLMYGY